MKRFVACVVLTFAVVAAACGSDGEADGGNVASTAEASTDPTASATEEPAIATEEADEPTEEATATPTPTALPDSARGVTADTITLGVALTDVSAFANTGNGIPRLEAIVDATNAAGGVGGRQVELVIESWEILDAVGSETACTVLMEDHEVFLVIGAIIPNFGDVLCYTDLHESIFINTSILDGADIEASDDRLFTTFPDDFDLLLKGLPELSDDLEGAPVAVYGTVGSEDRTAAASEVLESVGADVVVVTHQQTSASEDLVAAEAELDIHVERWLLEGAEWLVNVDGGIAGSLPALQRAGATDMAVVSPTIRQPSMVALGADLGAFDVLIGISAPVLDAVAEQGLYGIDECIQIVTAATGETIEPYPPEGEEAPLPPTVNMCAAWDFFVTLAEEAGAELTNDSFIQAGYDLSPFPITGYPSGSIAPGRAHLPNADAAVYEYDAASGEFVPR